MAGNERVDAILDTLAMRKDKLCVGLVDMAVCFGKVVHARRSLTHFRLQDARKFIFPLTSDLESSTPPLINALEPWLSDIAAGRLRPTLRSAPVPQGRASLLASSLFRLF